MRGIPIATSPNRIIPPDVNFHLQPQRYRGMEIIAVACRVSGLATVSYPGVKVTGTVKPLDNQHGLTLNLLRAEKPRGC